MRCNYCLSCWSACIRHSHHQLMRLSRLVHTSNGAIKKAHAAQRQVWVCSFVASSPLPSPVLFFYSLMQFLPFMLITMYSSSSLSFVASFQAFSNSLVILQDLGCCLQASLLPAGYLLHETRYMISVHSGLQYITVHNNSKFTCYCTGSRQADQGIFTAILMFLIGDI